MFEKYSVFKKGPKEMIYFIKYLKFIKSDVYIQINFN